jgi:hypothetical protein
LVFEFDDAFLLGVDDALEVFVLLDDRAAVVAGQVFAVGEVAVAAAGLQIRGVEERAALADGDDVVDGRRGPAAAGSPELAFVVVPSSITPAGLLRTYVALARSASGRCRSSTTSAGGLIRLLSRTPSTRSVRSAVSGILSPFRH